MTVNVPTAPDSAVERTLVARGWSDIDLAERLGPGATKRNRVATLEADHARARAWYRSPVSDHVPEGMRNMYESEANVVRFRRVVDFLTEGENVYEVGLGYGYLGTIMVREGRLGSYHGVDFVPECVTRTRKLLDVNGFRDRTTVEEKNLYDVTRADLDAAGASLLVCCEVIEHVPDPEKALATLRQALPEGTDLLFSIPLLGRLETVWGHGEIFGAARLQAMLAGAGLVPHHVEVLHDTWALILASATPDPSPRAAAALEGIAPVEPERLLEPPFRTLANVPVTSMTRAESARTKRVGDLSIEPTAITPDLADSPREGLRLTARAERITRGPGKGWPAMAGLAFEAPEGATGVRFQVDVPALDDVRHFVLEFRKDGERIGRWQWKPSEHRPKASAPTFLVAPGRKGITLKRVPGSVYEGADTVELYVTAVDDQPIDFSILRWAWVS